MTAELIAEEGTLKGVSLLLSDAESWVVGRDPETATLVLEDLKVSREHARITLQEGGYLLENISETNPVLVNDVPIATPTLLEEGDKVRIGGTLFYFYPEGAPPRIVEEKEPPIEEATPHATIFRPEDEVSEPSVDYGAPVRFVLKVIAGPNTGAEFALEEGKEYLIGTDTVACDIVFHDLSVSKEHAKLSLSSSGEVFIEDLGSRNGVVIDRKRIEEKSLLTSNQVVSCGTSALLVVDKEAPAETITAPMMGPAAVEEKEEFVPEELALEAAEKEAAPALKKEGVQPMSVGAFIIIVILVSLAVLVGIGMVSLFRGKEVVQTPPNTIQEIQQAVKRFDGVKFTYNAATKRLFIVGHVSTAVDKNELLYNLRGLTFISGIDDNIVVDEAIWQETNILLSKHPQWKGVNMYAPKPGEFVLSGYLKTNQEAAALMDYMNRNFAFLPLLKNEVIVEEAVDDEAKTTLVQQGFQGVTPLFSNGILSLTGYISSSLGDEYDTIVSQLKEIPGVQAVKSYVVKISPEEAVNDLNELYPGRFQVTGYSKHGSQIINVVINGAFYSRGESVEGYTITSLQPTVIFLQKDGLKYKIEYNR